METPISWSDFVSQKEHKKRTWFQWNQVLLAPQVGLEPTTLRLTAACSTNWAIEEYQYGINFWMGEAINLPHSYKSGGDLLSRDAAIQVSLALRSLTAVFGMGTGVTFS